MLDEIECFQFVSDNYLGNIAFKEGEDHHGGEENGLLVDLA